MQISRYFHCFLASAWQKHWYLRSLHIAIYCVLAFGRHQQKQQTSAKKCPKWVVQTILGGGPFLSKMPPEWRILREGRLHGRASPDLCACEEGHLGGMLGSRDRAALGYVEGMLSMLSYVEAMLGPSWAMLEACGSQMQAILGYLGPKMGYRRVLLVLLLLLFMFVSETLLPLRSPSCVGRASGFRTHSCRCGFRSCLSRLNPTDRTNVYKFLLLHPIAMFTNRLQYLKQPCLILFDDVWSCLIMFDHVCVFSYKAGSFISSPKQRLSNAESFDRRYKREQDGT